MRISSVYEELDVIIPSKLNGNTGPSSHMHAYDSMGALVLLRPSIMCGFQVQGA